MSLGLVLQPKSDADDRAAGFSAVQTQPDGEQYSGGTLLVVAYLAIWAILLAWIFLLWRRQASLSTRLDGLEAAIDRAAAAKETGKKPASGG